MSDWRKTFLKYSITTVVAGGLTLLVLYLHGYSSAADTVEKYRILADAFTIPGTLLILVTALIWVSSEGMFDGLGYAFSRVGGMIIPFFGKSKKHETYYDYKMRKKEKALHGYSFLFYVGLVFTAVALVFIYLHSTVYVPLV